MEVEHWDQTWGELTEQNMRRRLEFEGYRVDRYDYPPGTSFPNHTHHFDKKDAVLSGLFKIQTETRHFVLGPGDMLEVPAMTVHNAEVIGTQTVVSLDASKH